MKVFRIFLPILLLGHLCSGFATCATRCFNNEQDTSRFQQELNERDYEALREFVNSKRTINVEEKARNLTISGDMRTEWRHIIEKIGSNRVRGKGTFTCMCLPISKNDFNIDFNLRFDYVCDRAWGVAHLEFDNVAGVDDNCKDCKCCDKRLCEPCLCGRSSGSQPIIPIPPPPGPPGPPVARQENALILPGQSASQSGCSSNTFCKPCDCCTGELCKFKPKCCADPEGYHGSGYCNNICLKKAYFGYNLVSDWNMRLDIEIGRRNLYNVFDSQVQFLSRFDGVLLKWRAQLGGVSDIYLRAAGFLVDEVVNHFGWVVEGGGLNIGGCGLDVLYSFIDWSRRGKNRCFVCDPKGFRFRISQATAYLRGYNRCCCLPYYLYGAFLYNHGASKVKKPIAKAPEPPAIPIIPIPPPPPPQQAPPFSCSGCGAEDDCDCCCHCCDDLFKCFGKRNIAYYLGFNVGQVCECGDFAFDFQWQYVQAQAVPDNDMSGIGRGNVRNDSFTASNGKLRGNTNFKGFRIDGLYAMTDNLTLDMRVQASWQIDGKIGGDHSYSEFRLESIYAF